MQRPCNADATHALQESNGAELRHWICPSAWKARRQGNSGRRRKVGLVSNLHWGPRSLWLGNEGGDLDLRSAMAAAMSAEDFAGELGCPSGFCMLSRIRDDPRHDPDNPLHPERAFVPGWALPLGWTLHPGWILHPGRALPPVHPTPLTDGPYIPDGPFIRDGSLFPSIHPFVSDGPFLTSCHLDEVPSPLVDARRLGVAKKTFGGNGLCTVIDTGI